MGFLRKVHETQKKFIMKKLLSLLFIVAIISPVRSQNLADTYYGDLTCLGGGLYELEVILDTRNTTSIAGFQFEVTNILIDSVYGGLMDQYGWTTFTGFNPTVAPDTGRLLAAAFGPPYIPSGLGVLFKIRFSNPNMNTTSCLTNVILSDSTATQIFTSIGPCTTLPPYINNKTSAICNGQSIFLGGANQTTSGTYYDTLVSAFGCDSVIITGLTVHSTYLLQDTVSICADDSAALGNTYYNTSGTHYDSSLTVAGCDSISVLHLTVNPTYSFNQYQYACDGDSIVVGGIYYSQPGTYYDTYQTTESCDSIIVYHLTFYSLPSANITQSGYVLTSDLATSYQWYLDGVDISGATSQTYTASQSGSYSVMVTDSNGCSSTSATVDIVVVGIENVVNSFGLKVVPNPFEDAAIVLLPNQINAMDLYLYDITGGLVWEQKAIQGNSTKIYKNGLKPGLYFLELRGGSDSFIGKVMIQ